MGGNAADITSWDNFDSVWISKVSFRQAHLPQEHLLQAVGDSQPQCSRAVAGPEDTNGLSAAMGLCPVCEKRRESNVQPVSLLSQSIFRWKESVLPDP